MSKNPYFVLTANNEIKFVGFYPDDATAHLREPTRGRVLNAGEVYKIIDQAKEALNNIPQG